MNDKKKPVVLVICPPEPDLCKEFKTIVLKPYIGEVPMGVLYLAGQLEEASFQSIIFDLTVDPRPTDEFLEELDQLDPLLVGFSVTLLNVRFTNELACRFKSKRPDIPIIYGGPHVTILPQKHADYDFVDFVVTNEGELALVELAKQVQRGGINARFSHDKKIIEGQHPNFDELALPARHLVDIGRYRRRGQVMDVSPTDIVCTSRGCPFNCAFCSSKTIWHQKYYMRSPEKVVDEIEFLMREYGTKGIYFREDNFTVNRQHVFGMCDQIKRRNLDIRWECESRVDTVTKDMLVAMKEAGCSGIWCGVESGSPRILKKIRKGFTIDKVLSFYEWCRELDIPTHAMFMLGFSGETPDDLRATYELALKLPTNRVQFATYCGFPGSEMYDEIKGGELVVAQWEDLLISRNEYFTQEQLYELEAAMNYQANRNRFRLGTRKISIERTIRWLSYAAHPKMGWRLFRQKVSKPSGNTNVLDLLNAASKR